MENKIGKVIRESRKALGYTQEQLAEKVGMTPSFIGQIERGTTLPSVETLSNLTRLLAIDANLYFHDNNDQDQERREFYLIFERLSPKIRKMAKEILRQIYKHDR